MKKFVMVMIAMFVVSSFAETTYVQRVDTNGVLSIVKITTANTNNIETVLAEVPVGKVVVTNGMVIAKGITTMAMSLNKSLTPTAAANIAHATIASPNLREELNSNVHWWNSKKTKIARTAVHDAFKAGTDKSVLTDKTVPADQAISLHLERLVWEANR